MKRLTGRKDEHVYLIGCPPHETIEEVNAIIQQAVDRLAAYEDTGLEPEEISGQKGWIKVEERLPQAFRPVIVCREDGKVEQGMKDVGDWWKVYGTRTKHITHWRPLPESPKEGKAITRGQAFRRSDEDLTALLELCHDQDISVFWCDNSCGGQEREDFDCTDEIRRQCILRWLQRECKEDQE